MRRLIRVIQGVGQGGLILSLFFSAAWAKELSKEGAGAQSEKGIRPMQEERVEAPIKEAAKAQFEEGVRLLRAGKLEESVRILEALSVESPDERDLQFYLGVGYQGLRRYQEAEQALKRAILLDSTHLPSHLQLAALYEETQRLEEALEEYEKLIQLEPEGGGARQGSMKKLQIQGVLRAKAGEYEAALRFFKEAAELVPEESLNYYNIGQVYLRMKEDTLAEEAFQRVIKIDPQHLDAYINLGNIYERQRRLGEAIEAYIKVAQIDPESSQGRSARLKVPLLQGTLLGLQRRFDEALEVFRQALRFSPDPAPIHFNIGLIYLEQGNFQKGEEALIEAIRSDPNHQAARLSLGTLYEDQGKLEEGLRAYEIARNIQPDSPTGIVAAINVHILQGRLFEKEGKLDDALSEFKAAADKQPQNPMNFFRQGLVHLRKAQSMAGQQAKDELAAAEKAFEQVVRLNPSAQDAYLGLADIYEKTGRDEKAIEAYEKTISIAPGAVATLAGARLHLLKGVLLAQEERYEEARVEFEETLRISPNEKSAHTNLGQLHLQKREGPAALEHFIKGLEIDPTDRNLRFRLASLYGELGRTAEALRLYQSLLDEEVPEGFAEEIRERAHALYSSLSLGYSVIYDSNINLDPNPQADFKSELSGRYQRLIDLSRGWRAGLRLDPSTSTYHRSQVSIFTGQTGLFLDRKGYLQGMTLGYNYQFNLFGGSLSFVSHDLSWEGYAPSDRYSMASGSIRLRYINSVSDERYSGIQPSLSGSLVQGEAFGGQLTLSGIVFGNKNTEASGRENAYIGLSPSVSYDWLIIPGAIGNFFYTYNVSRYLVVESGFDKKRSNQGHSIGGGLTVNLEKGIQISLRGSWSNNRSNLAGVASTLEQAVAGNSSRGDYERWIGAIGFRFVF